MTSYDHFAFIYNRGGTRCYDYCGEADIGCVKTLLSLLAVNLVMLSLSAGPAAAFTSRLPIRTSVNWRLCSGSRPRIALCRNAEIARPHGFDGDPSLKAKDKQVPSSSPAPSPFCLPNLITIARICCVPLLLAAFYSNKRWSNMCCSFLFVCASVTDWLDGYISRRWALSSPLGAFLDPVADKLLVSTALLLISVRFRSGFVLVPAIAIICREITISALREWMASVGRRDVVRVAWWGKVKTCTQMLALSILLLYMPPAAAASVAFESACMAGLALLWASTFLAIKSAADYLRAAWPALSNLN